MPSSSHRAQLVQPGDHLGTVLVRLVAGGSFATVDRASTAPTRSIGVDPGANVMFGGTSRSARSSSGAVALAGSR